MNALRSEVLGSQEKCEWVSCFETQGRSWESVPALSETIQNNVLRAVVDIVFDDKIMVAEDYAGMASNVSVFFWVN
jgi:hypothetical protein